MTDLSKTIAPKSDQLNADDLIGREITVTITKVSAGNAEQPIAINFEGDRGKPYFPSKGMRRVMVMVWGADGNEYVGRSMRLYRDPKVLFGGIAVGGIRISHMSHISEDTTVPVAESKGARKPVKIKVLRQDAVTKMAQTDQGQAPAASGRSARQAAPSVEHLTMMADKMVTALDNAKNYEAFEAIINDANFIRDRKLLDQQTDLAERVKVAEQAAFDYFKQGTNVPGDEVTP